MILCTPLANLITSQVFTTKTKLLIMKKLILTGLVLISVLLSSVSAQFVQAPLPYSYDALEPAIDAKTMEVHYSRHHAAYVKNLNAALESEGKSKQTDIIAILKNISAYSGTVRNNAGGHYNHELFWSLLTPRKDTKPSPELDAAITAAFGDMEQLKLLFAKQATSVFGSGWAWLLVTPDHKLVLSSTPNQDNPLMDVAAVKGFPILAIDVWEHAYYLKYQNRRADYIESVWNIINWETVSANYAAAINSKF